MNMCKNVECKNYTKGKRVYCSLSCRNFYVNKFIRDYTKNGDAIRYKFRVDYIPKICENSRCDNQIPFERKRNRFCSSSCGASMSGLGRIVSPETRTKMSITHSINNPKTLIECGNCGIEFPLNNRKVYCSSKCKTEFKRKHMSEFSKYKQDSLFKFSLNQFPDEFEFSLIKKFGWYSPSNKGNNIGGVSRDHMLSVREGFELGVDPFMLAHPANCRLMIHSDNISKNKKSIITVDELEERIKMWDDKYNFLCIRLPIQMVLFKYWNWFPKKNFWK